MDNPGIDQNVWLPSAQYKFCAIVGNPVSQVKSVEIFNKRFSELDQKRVMIPISVSEEGLGSLFTFFRYCDNFEGIIVTIPYKESCVRFLDKLSPISNSLGVANVVYKHDKDIVGTMSDGLGVVNALENAGVELAGRTACIIGCGAAGSAIAWSMLEKRVSKLILRDRPGDPAPAINLSNNLSRYFNKAELVVDMDRALRADIIVNASGLGMREDDPLPCDPGEIQDCLAVAESVTQPKKTPFVRMALDQNKIVTTGADMALGQSAIIANYFGVTF